MNVNDLQMDPLTERILRDGYQTISRTAGGFEKLAKRADPYAQEYAILYGFDHLSPETIDVLKNNGCCFVRMAVEAMEMQKKLVRLIANKAATMICPGKAFSNPLTGEVFNNLPSSFLNFTNLSKNV